MTDSSAGQRLTELMSRISKLPGSNLEPPQFFANFLQLSVAVTGSKGGAIWVIQPEQQPQCYCHVELESCQIQSPQQQQLIVEAVAKTVAEGRVIVVPPAEEGYASSVSTADAPESMGKQNQCVHPLFFKPLRAGQQVAMVLQIIGPARLDPESYRTVVGILEQAGDAAERYLAHRRASVLDDDRKSLAKLLQYAEGVHKSLEPEKVVYNVANLGRDAIGCDRVVVWIDPKFKRGLRAVSGIDKPDKRAVLLQAVEKLSEHCLKINQPIVASRARLVELAEEEELTILLRHYFNVSQLDQIFLQPMVGDDNKAIGVLVAEGFEEQASVNLAGILANVAKHGALAIKNASDVAALPLMRPFAKLKQQVNQPKRRRRLIGIGAGALVVLLAGLLIPWPVEIDCACALAPADRRVVDSPLDGVQILDILQAQGPVQANQVVVQLNDDELKTQMYSQQAALEQEQAKLNQAMILAADSTEAKLSKLQTERLQKEIDFIKLQIEKCKVRSPIDGTILTDRLEQRKGVTVKKGDVIFEVANLQDWQLVLDVPQEEVGWVMRGLAEQPAEKPGLSIEYYLAAYPEKRLACRMEGKDQISQMAQTKQDGNVFEVRVDVPTESLAAIHQGLRDGSIGRGKIVTADRPLGYVLLRKVIRFFRVTFF